MAYFSNGTEGMAFEIQCSKCRYGLEPCPIALVQSLYNYDAVNNKVATDILNGLVKNDGTCSMYEMMESIDNLNSKPLFPELIPEIINQEK